MKRDALDEAKRWTEQAEADIKSAKYNIEGGIFYLACFLAQQAAEKALKGVFYADGEEFVFGHSVQELCKRASLKDVVFKEHLTDAAKLDRYYIPTRYPNGLPGGIPAYSFDKEDASSAVKIAEAIMKSVVQYIIASKSE